MVVLGRRGRIRRVVARLSHGERLWLAVEAAADLTVEARTWDGRALRAQSLGGGDQATCRQFGPALGDGNVPVFSAAPKADFAWGVEIWIGGRVGLCVAFLRADAFDTAFGAPAQVTGAPRVYTGWRLP